jgi:excisionase family DNA binding protein
LTGALRASRLAVEALAQIGAPRIGARESAIPERLQSMSVSTSAPARRQVLSTREAAVELGVSERTLRRYITSGLIGFRRLPGGHYRIPREAIAEFWRRHTPPPARKERRTPLAARPPRARPAREAGGEGGRRPRLSASRTPRTYEVPPAKRGDAIAAEHAAGR